MKDLFVGGLGRLNNHGGSRMFTTPHTINVPPEYSVETDVPSVAEFVTCSLDGRLWVYRRSRRFYVAAFRWDVDTQRLVFVSTMVLSNANIIGRGIDWLLTDTMIIQASHNAPYIFSANLSDADGSNPINAVEKQFSFLPAIGDWQIIGNYLVRRPEGFSGNINIMPLLIGASHIITYNGQIWAKDSEHIGRCYIFPGALSANGNIDKYCLYVAPCYTHDKNIIPDSDWSGLKLFVKTDDSLCGFLSEQLDSLDSRLCYPSETPKIFLFFSGEWLELPDNSKSFIDTLNNSGAALNDNNFILLNENNTPYSCKGMQQWVAPTGMIDAVACEAVISPCNNSILATHTCNGFHRELLVANRLSLSAITYSGKKLSLGDSVANSRKTISVNSLKADSKIANIAWEDIFRSFVSIELVNVQKILENYPSVRIWFVEETHTVTEENCRFPVYLGYGNEVPVLEGYEEAQVVSYGNALGKLQTGLSDGYHLIGNGIFTYHYWDFDSCTIKEVSYSLNDYIKTFTQTITIGSFRRVGSITISPAYEWKYSYEDVPGLIETWRMSRTDSNNGLPRNAYKISLFEYDGEPESPYVNYVNKRYPFPDVITKYTTSILSTQCIKVSEYASYLEAYKYIYLNLPILNVNIGFEPAIDLSDDFNSRVFPDSTSIITTADELSIYSKYVICIFNYRSQLCAFYRVTIDPEIFNIYA